MKGIILRSRSGETVYTGSIPNVSPRRELVTWEGRLFTFCGVSDDWEDIYIERFPYVILPMGG